MTNEKYGDLWSYLAKSDKKIIMYGMGNGADKILSICAKRGIEVCDFFASDGFVRGHLFHGKRVLSFSEAKEKYGAENMIVLLSFASSLPNVLENIYKIASECELYAPDVPVAGDGLFDINFVREHRDEIETAYSLFADDVSRDTYEKVIKFKLSGDIEYLKKCEAEPEEVYSSLVLNRQIDTYIDLGAYNGDTIHELLAKATPKDIVAFEPDRRNFKKLSAYISEADSKTRISALHAGAWSSLDTLSFDASGNRNAGFKSVGKTVEVNADTLDRIIFSRGLFDYPEEEIAKNGSLPEGFSSVDYIKYDVEGAESKALDGSAETIKKFAPNLLVSLYHRNEDIFALPIKIKSLCPEYSLYLRKLRYVPAWDLNLYAIKGDPEK